MIVQSDYVWMDDVFIKAQLSIQDGKIKAVYPYGKYTVDKDYTGRRIVPGFIDIHTHGSHGVDTWSATEEKIEQWMRVLPEEGITGVCPTIMTPDEKVLTNALQSIVECKSKVSKGSEILGIHIEGVCIQNNKSIDSSVEAFQVYQEMANNLIKIITIAPEKDEDYALCKYCSINGVNVSLGHANPTYEEACMAYANGAKGVTHVFNGMSTLKPKSQGLINLALRFDHLYGEIICDGQDVTPDLLHVYFNTKKDYAIMVTDTLGLKGLPVGSEMNIMGSEFYVAEDYSVKMKNTGQYAIPNMKMNEQLRLLVEEALVPWKYAIHSCTINPATYLGIANRKGRLCAGFDADFVILNQDYSIDETYVCGVSRYKKQT